MVAESANENSHRLFFNIILIYVNIRELWWVYLFIFCADRVVRNAFGCF
jgi:hypothetical protein